MNDVKSVRFRRDQVSVLNGNNCPLSAGFSVRNRRNMHQEREIDFVAQKGTEIKYIQVAYLIADEKVKQREFGNLLKINDNYEKIVVSADEFIADYKGVRHLSIKQFLSSMV